MDKNEQTTRHVAWLLSLGGFLPFLFLAITLLIIGNGSPLFELIFELFKIWSVIILAFIAGIRWGFAIAYPPFDLNSLLLSVIPAIMVMFSLLLPDIYTIFLLLLLYSAHGAWDSFFASSGKSPPWFGTIRMTLTFLVVAAHIIVAFAISSSGS